jgi:hypothetical protein
MSVSNKLPVVLAVLEEPCGSQAVSRSGPKRYIPVFVTIRMGDRVVGQDAPEGPQDASRLGGCMR